MAMELRSQCVFIMLLVVLVIVDNVKCDAKAREECATQLVGLSTCLPYVSGTAKAPTPDCCSGLKQVLTKSMRCLCFLVRDRNDPNLNLKVNATLALNLPASCKSDVPLGNCIELLKLDPKSPEAQVFQQFDKSLHNKTPPTLTANTSTIGANTQAKTNTGTGNRCLGNNMAGQIALWSFATLLIKGL